MKLIPLKQWICDSCGGIIEKPEEQGKKETLMILLEEAKKP